MIQVNVTIDEKSKAIYNSKYVPCIKKSTSACRRLDIRSIVLFFISCLTFVLDVFIYYFLDHFLAFCIISVIAFIKAKFILPPIFNVWQSKKSVCEKYFDESGIAIDSRRTFDLFNDFVQRDLNNTKYFVIDKTLCYNKPEGSVACGELDLKAEECSNILVKLNKRNKNNYELVFVVN